MNKKRLLLILVLAAALGAVLIRNLGPKEEVRIEVQVEPARMEAITQVVTASGKIRPETQVKVSADVGGYIRKLTVKDGDRVEQGQLLVEVDQEVYRARVAETLAAEKTAQARLKLSQASLRRVQGEERRIRGLYRKDLTSAANLERSQADLAMAQAEVEASEGQLAQARAMLSKSRKDLDKCTILAPMSGVVIEQFKERGERVSGGDFREDIILTLADLSSMEVEVEVGERDVVIISPQDEVEIEVDAYPNQVFSGQVKEIGNAGITRNQWTESEVTNFRIVVQVGKTEAVLRPQMSATVRIRTDHRDQTLTIPIQSVTLRRPSEIKPPAGKDDQKSEKPTVEDPIEVVFAMDAGKVQARPVKTGLSSDTRIEILEGLEEGEKIISGPYRALAKDLKQGSLVTTEKKKGSKGRSRRSKHGR